MRTSYNLGIMQALDELGIVKVANPALAGAVASGANPTELQGLADAKITEKDIESAAKIVQVLAEMKQKADEAGLMPAEGQGQPGQGQRQQAQPQIPMEDPSVDPSTLI
jgi:hypothetical protein